MEPPLTFPKIVKQLISEHKSLLLLAVFLAALAGFIQASSILSMAPIIDMLLHPDLTQASPITLKILDILKHFNIPRSFIVVTMCFLLMIILKNIIYAISQYIFCKLNFKLVKNIIFDEFKTFLSSNMQFFTSKKYGMLGNTLLKETEKVGLAFEAISLIFSLLLSILFYMGMAFLLSWKLTLIMIFMLSVTLIPFSLLGKKTYKIGKFHTQAANEFQETILETFNAIKLILGFSNQKKSISKLEKIIPTYIHTAIQFVMIRILTPLTFEPLGMIIVIVAIYLGLTVFTLPISVLLVLLYAFRVSCQNALDAMQHKNSILNMAPALEQIYHLKQEAESMIQPSGHILFQKLKKGLFLKNISFSYPENPQDILKEIHMTFPKGKTIAIVGKSGAGKTTFINLLMGFYPIKNGTFLVDHAPFHTLDIYSWRKKIGFVPQEPFLFNTSIKNNLLWSVDTATKTDIYEACRLAYADEFIEKFPQKYETIVGEHGIKLSGGQRQRIALARAILKKPELLILDEATSSLDSHSETLIQKSIEKISKETTLILIAHRLSTVKKCDYIYVLNNGTVIEEGSFMSLSQNKEGEFYKTARLQGMDQSNLANDSIT